MNAASDKGIATYRRPLAVYIVAHPESEQATQLAEAIFRHVCQDTANPLAWGLQIPVRFRSRPAAGESVVPAPIPFDEDDPAAAAKTAVVVLVDEKMLLDRANWGPYVVGLSEACQRLGSHHRLFPVRLTDKAHKLDPVIAAEQFIAVSREHYPEAFLNRLTHELCRLVLDKPRAPVDGQGRASAAGPSPVRVFLSHAKRDGEPIAIAFREYIDGSTQMNAFFDTVDIPSGSKWADVLNESSGEMALLAIHTDAYASRPWCQREVLNAKDRNLPVVVLDALERGETRSFPYLGNTPTVRWDHDDPYRFERVLGVLLKEVLRNAYFRQRTAALLALYRIAPEHVIIATHPELLSITRLSTAAGWRDGQLVIYPDPPIAQEELSRLVDLLPGLRLVTPSMLPAFSTVSA